MPSENQGKHFRAGVNRKRIVEWIIYNIDAIYLKRSANYLNAKSKSILIQFQRRLLIKSKDDRMIIIVIYVNHFQFFLQGSHQNLKCIFFNLKIFQETPHISNNSYGFFMCRTFFLFFSLQQVVELNGYVIIVVESRDNKIKLYGSPADRDNLEVGDEILDVNERKLEDLPRAEVIRYIHEVNN